jgi:hypothetical protein
VTDRGRVRATLPAVRATSLEHLVATFREHADEGRYAVTDLSLGAWRSRSAASEVASQLGRPGHVRSVVPSGLRLPGNQRSYAEIVGAGIDAEASGDRTIIHALAAAIDLVEAFRGQAKPTIFVLAPRFGFGWTTEDEAFVAFLSQMLDERVFLVAADASEPPASPWWSIRWAFAPEATAPVSSSGLAALLPGVIDSRVIASLPDHGLNDANSLALADGSRLVAPERRRAPGERRRLDHDRLAEAMQSFPHLEAYAQCHGNNLYVDAKFLAARAWELFAEGSVDTSLRLLRRAAECSRAPAEQAALQAQVQGMRIASSRFDAVANEADPAPSLPPSLRGFLLQAKGWGLVMGPEPSRARPYLDEARELLAGSFAAGDREYLYLLNISALCSFKSGDLVGALDLERQIARRAAELPERDHRLEYVNAVNQARLHRRRGELEQAEQCQEQGFATSFGARSAADAVYVNVCRARLAAQQGHAEASLVGYVRAALHWLASWAPEAVGSRVVESLGVDRTLRGEASIEAFSAALLERLDAAWAQARDGAALPVTRGGTIGPTFARVTDLPGSAVCEDAFGGDGWSVLSTGVALPERHRATSHQALRAWLARWIAGEACAPAIDEATTFVVDDRDGREMATSALELIETCVGRRVRRILFAGEAANLDGPTCQTLERGADISLGPGVDRIDLGTTPVTVTFKRSLSPLALTADEAQLVLALTASRTPIQQLIRRCGEEPQAERVIEIARALERSHVLIFEIAEETCRSVGINLASKRTSAKGSPG